MERKDGVAVTSYMQKLPPPICKELLKEKSQSVTLQSRLGGWEISLCKHSENDELMCLNEGWAEFVDRHALSTGDFLYLFHSGDLHFHAYMFDPTACEKEFRHDPENQNSSRQAEMGENQISIRSKFIRIMLTGFRKRLKLPPAYCKKVIKHEKSKRAILQSCKGEWDVKVCRDDDGKIVLKNGWPRFAHEHGLSLGDFLVFKHTGNLHFNVVVCNSTGCEKQFLVESDNDNKHQTINPKKAPLCSQSPCFTHKMTRYTAKETHAKVTIPTEFVKSNGLENKKGTILKDPQSGRKWRVQLAVRKVPWFNMAMVSGWHDFARANYLEIADVCTFQLNPTKSQTSENIYFDVRISRNTRFDIM